MLRNRLYYALKPFLPASMRLAVRRWFALRKRARVAGVWPILPGSEKPPEGWPGWPDGKQFACVLSHDVESQAGLDRCRQLMKLEMDLGFRSSFNFIPEGNYEVPQELIDEIKRNGFEVGVHDLNHDGKLYRNRAEFADKARRINQHLRNWGAVGFRSGFMLRQMNWLSDLNVLYDSSTFDTDPFEPQPDGLGTIFPTWFQNQNSNPTPAPKPGTRNSKLETRNPKLETRNSEPETRNPKPETQTSEPSTPHSALRTPNSKAGYVELPYTLAQDSTVFLLLEESSPDLWTRKLEWIAQHHGMAMLNVHPDYIDFTGAGQSGVSYPARLYAGFLQDVKRRFTGRYWHALPWQVADFAKIHLAPKGNNAARVASGRGPDSKKKDLDRSG